MESVPKTLGPALFAIAATLYTEAGFKSGSWHKLYSLRHQEHHMCPWYKGRGDNHPAVLTLVSRRPANKLSAFSFNSPGGGTPVGAGGGWGQLSS